MLTSGIQHTISTVSQRTGLSPHVIRVWEKRYGTIRPARSGGNQRVYSETDIKRLQRLQELTQRGFSISKVAHLDDATLGEMVAADLDKSSTKASNTLGLGQNKQAIDSVAQSLDAIRRMDLAGLEDCLEQALLAHGQMGLLERVIAPLTRVIGEEWRLGRLHVAHEHLATSTLRTFLGKFIRPYTLHTAAPVLVATTPSGQLHELGAILVSATASGLGWRVSYAGASMPAEEIARIALNQTARVVALSLIHPEDDPQIPQELQRLRRLLPPSTAIVIGGRAAGAYAEGLSANGFLWIRTLDELRSTLDSFRTGHQPQMENPIPAVA